MTINTESTAWLIKHALRPKLSPKSVGVMDNASFRKGAGMKQDLTQARYTLLYLSPIEKKWAQAKKIRMAIQCTVEELFKH